MLGKDGNILDMVIDRRHYKGFSSIYGQQLHETGQIIGCASPMFDPQEASQELKVAWSWPLEMRLPGYSQRLDCQKLWGVKLPSGKAGQPQASRIRSVWPEWCGFVAGPCMAENYNVDKGLLGKRAPASFDKETKTKKKAEGIAKLHIIMVNC